MISILFNALFGCRHAHCSIPITLPPGSRRTYGAAAPTGTYVVCLSCGKELAYDWQQMKIVSKPRDSNSVCTLVTKAAR